MALSPADYAAYSRATGTPYPEDPEERAQITPAVLEFRRNQLRAPQEESNLPGILGAAALGLGALAGGVGIARALTGKRAQVPPSSRPPVTPQGEQAVYTASAEGRRRAAEEVTRQARTERPVGVVQTDLSQKNLEDFIRSSPAFGRVPTREPKESAAPGIVRSLPAAAERPDLLAELTASPSYVQKFAAIEEPAAPNFATLALPARAERPDLLTGITAAPGYAREFVANRVAEQMAGDLIDEVNAFSTPAARSELARQQASVQGQKRKDLWDLVGQIRNESLVSTQETIRPVVSNQALNALESGEDQMTGRMKAQLSRNEDLDMSQVEMLENIAQQNNALMRAQAEPSQMIGYVPDEPINQAAAQLPDGIPIDQAESLTVLDLRQRQAIRVSPRALGLEQEQDPLVQEARQYLRSQEIDTDFDYSAENIRQAAQVRDRIERAQALQEEANSIIAGLRAESQVTRENLSPQEFAAAFNKQYREELNPELRMVDNTRQRQELRGAQAGVEGEDVVSLLLGDVPEVETTMRGKALRGGKLNRAGDISYMDESGQEYASADTGVKARQGQGVQYKEHALLTNEVKPIIGRASDEELTSLLLEGQASPLRQALKERVAQKLTRYQDPRQLNLLFSSGVGEQQAISTSLDTYLTNLASQTLVARALKNPEPTALQTAALNRARASVAASEEIRQQARIQSQQKPTIAPGPAQDVARAMETLRRGMIVDPSEPLPVMPSVQQLRTGYASDEEIGPILGASDVYTGAAAEAAGPVIFTGKSKANTVLATPPIIGSIDTPTGRYLTQNNPDVLGTVYNVAGTPANRAISRQVEANAQAFLADAITGGMQVKTVSDPESYVTPRASATSQLELFPAQAPQVSSISPMRLAGALGAPGIDPSKRTLYAQYQPGRSVPVPRSPFIGEMTGGTVVVVPPIGASTGTRRDIGAPSASIDLTRRGEKSRYFSLYPEEQFITGIEPAPIGPITQSPGLSKLGRPKQQVIQGAGNLPIVQLTSRGQSISYPRMDKPAKALGFRGETVTNVPRYGIDPGAEDWREDLMRSAYRRGGPVRTSIDLRQLGIEGRGLELLLEYLNTPKP
jgi:hypothetical protein